MGAITSAIVGGLTAIGSAVGAGTGAVATAVGAGVAGAATYGVVRGVGEIAGGGERGSEAAPVQPVTDTGALSDEEARDIARKKLFRSGTVFTSPLGAPTGTDQTSQVRLK